MTHKSITHSPIPVAHFPGLLRLSSGRFQLNKRVPVDLRGHFGKSDPIRIALGTSNRKEAESRYHFEYQKLLHKFEQKRRELKLSAERVKQRRSIEDLSEKEKHDLVLSWFIEMEKRHETWWASEKETLDKANIEERIEALRTDESAYSGGTECIGGIEAANCNHTLALLLEEANIDPGITFAKYERRRLEGGGAIRQAQAPRSESKEPSPAFRRMSSLLKQATLESVRRSMDRMERGDSFVCRDRTFAKTFHDTQPPVIEHSRTLDDLLSKYEENLVELEIDESTRQTYRIPFRLLREKIGRKTPLVNITKELMGEICLFARRIPVNATQRFPGMTFEEAVAAADRADAPRIHPTTYLKYLNNIAAIFNFASGMGLMDSNPMPNKYMRARLQLDRQKRKGKSRKDQFDIPQLNLLFRTPLYTGCEDDMRAPLRKGKYRGRRGRFWCPLIALFHGLRLNEAAQLEITDIIEIEEIPFFQVREETDDKSADRAPAKKKVKTPQSIRRIPIHPALIEIGFLKFVEGERERRSCGSLFPELPIGRNKKRTDPFSKWFGRFKTAVLDDKCKATFHSFRHMFVDALIRARVQDSVARELGGWINRDTESAFDVYGTAGGARFLRAEIEKVSYEGLDLSHLTGDFCNQLHPGAPPRPRKRRMKRITESQVFSVEDVK